MKSIFALRKILNEQLSKVELPLLEYLEFVYKLSYIYLYMGKNTNAKECYMIKILEKFSLQVDLLEIARTNTSLCIKIYTISICLKELGLIEEILPPWTVFLEEKELSFKEYLNLVVLDCRYGGNLSANCAVKYKLYGCMNDYDIYPELVFYKKETALWKKRDNGIVVEKGRKALLFKEYDVFLNLFFVEEDLRIMLNGNWDTIVNHASLYCLLLLEVKILE